MNRHAGIRFSLPFLTMLAIVGSSGIATGGWNTWTGLGPKGLTVTSIAVDPATPSTIYGMTYTGVYKSVNAGIDWRVIDGLPDFISALVIDPATPSTLYVGAVERGVYKSANGGNSWISANAGLRINYVTALAIDPKSPATLYAGLFDYGCDGPCAFKSMNGAVTWGAIGDGRTPADILELTIDPTNPANVYAGTYGSGIFKSEDGGDTWRAISVGLSGNFVSSIVVDPLTPTTIYAAPFGYPSGPNPVGSVFKSTDGGETWREANRGLTAVSVRELAINPRTPSTLYAGTPTGVFRSSNGGDSWAAINDGLSNTNVLALAVDPSNPDRLYAGTTGGGVFEYEAAPGPCTPGLTTLCLNGGRFAVTAAWATREGQTGSGLAIALTGDTGYFTFFDPANVELMVKVLNGCGVNSRYWTFAAGLTDVHVALTLTDSRTGAVRTYTNEQGVPFQPIQDTSGFATCP